jgi:hypothetical protein
MSTKVWMSALNSNSSVGMKQGLRSKYYGYDWTPASFTIPMLPKEVAQASKRQQRGIALQRHEQTEAVAVWNEKSFSRVRDIFCAGPFYAVKGRLIEVFSNIDMGEGGLVPFTIYEADCTTPKDIECYFLNVGCVKDSLVAEKCEVLRNLGNDRVTGRPLYTVNSIKSDGRVVLSKKALDGPDLWVEDLASRKFFMSDRLARALIKARMKDVFRLTPCLIDGVDI